MDPGFDGSALAVRVAGGALPPVVWGVVTGLLLSRGPVTVVEALVSLGVSLVAGLAAGWASRSRWAMPASPVLFAVVVEVVRIGAVGPTVDAPHLSVFGVLALVAGRGVHGLLALLPLVLGAAYGAGLARRRAGISGGRVGRYLGRGVAGVLALAVALVTIGVALPARTAPIGGGRGIAELTTVAAGPHRLGLMIRGADRTKPVLLFVPGAPGAAERGAVRGHLAGLERQFVVATLDRRGGGSSYAALEPTATMGIDDEVRSVLATADYLRDRFDAKRIYLMAHSGGTIPSVLAVQRRPSSFAAYVGVGQAVDTAAADRAQYAATLDWARQHRDGELVSALTAVGRPPYASLYEYEPMVLAESRVFPRATGSGGGGGQGGIDESLAAPEYSFLERVHVLAGFVDAYDRYYPATQTIDLRQRVRHLDVPVSFVDGEAEVPVRLRLMREWYAGLAVPHKERYVLRGAGHRSMYQRPVEFGAILGGQVLRGLACCPDG